MATHSSVLAWRIPGTGEPGGLPSMGSHRVGHDWSDLAAVNRKKKWKRKEIYSLKSKQTKSLLFERLVELIVHQQIWPRTIKGKGTNYQYKGKEDMTTNSIDIK